MQFEVITNIRPSRVGDAMVWKGGGRRDEALNESLKNYSKLMIPLNFL